MSLVGSLLAGVACGIGRRVAGGVLGQYEATARWRLGDQPVRLFFGATTSLAALMAGVPWYWALALTPATWVGTTTSNFDSMAMGRGRRSRLHDYLGMTLHGALSAALPALGAWWLGYQWWPIAISGLLCAPLYDYGWWVAGPYQGIHRMPRGLQSGTEFGELLWGAFMGIGIYTAGVLGT